MIGCEYENMRDVEEDDPAGYTVSDDGREAYYVTPVTEIFVPSLFFIAGDPSFYSEADLRSQDRVFASRAPVLCEIDGLRCPTAFPNALLSTEEPGGRGEPSLRLGAPARRQTCAIDLAEEPDPRVPTRGDRAEISPSRPSPREDPRRGRGAAAISSLELNLPSVSEKSRFDRRPRNIDVAAAASPRPRLRGRPPRNNESKLSERPFSIDVPATAPPRPARRVAAAVLSKEGPTTPVAARAGATTSPRRAARAPTRSLNPTSRIA